MNLYNDFDFEPPFANQHQEDVQPDTYQPITVNLSAENVEFLNEILLIYINDNAEVLEDKEWQKIEEIQNLLAPGIIHNNPPAA